MSESAISVEFTQPAGQIENLRAQAKASQSLEKVAPSRYKTCEECYSFESRNPIAVNTNAPPQSLL